jgi:uncharacterized RDD family membrane protein YckC
MESSPEQSGYYIVERGEKKGPLELLVLQTMQRQGTLAEDTLVWQDGMADWQPARVVLTSMFTTGETLHTLTLASRGQRVLAGIIDFILIIVPMNLLIGPSAVVTLGAALLGELAYPIFNAIYAGLLVAGPWQATVGMKVLGLKVVNASGGKPSPGSSWGRALASILSCYVFGLGYWLLFFTERHQTLHDLLARTLVVKDSAK